MLLIKSNPYCYEYIKQVRKKKRSLHEATARKGRKTPNCTAKRNEKNTKQIKHLCLHDTAIYNHQQGYVSGFSGKYTVYIKDCNDKYISAKDKNYTNINIKNIQLLYRNNNWILNSKISQI